MNEEIFNRKIEKLRNAKKVLENDNIPMNIDSLIDDLIKYKEKAKILIEEIKLNPQDYKLHIELGFILERFNQFEEAEKEYKEALKLNPESYEAHCHLGMLYYDLKRLKEAEIEFRESLKLNPNYVDAHFNLGHLLFDLGKEDVAYNEYLFAIRKEPFLAEKLAILALLSENRDEKIKKLTIAKKLYSEINNQKKVEEIDKVLKSI